MTLVNAEMMKKRKEKTGGGNRERVLCLCLFGSSSLRSAPTMALAYTRRLNKELAEIHADTPVGINLVNADTLEKWLFTIEVMGTSEYEVSRRYRFPICG